VLVRIAIEQKDARILPEMGARVSFLADQQTAGAAAGARVARDAVQVSGDTGVLFVIHDDTLERRAVRLGAADGDRLAVLSGLNPGERVAVGDFARLKDGARIRVEP